VIAALEVIVTVRCAGARCGGRLLTRAPPSFFPCGIRLDLRYRALHLDLRAVVPKVQCDPCPKIALASSEPSDHAKSGRKSHHALLISSAENTTNIRTPIV